METKKSYSKNHLQFQLELEQQQKDRRYKMMRKTSFALSVIAIIVSIVAIVLKTRTGQ